MTAIVVALVFIGFGYTKKRETQKQFDNLMSQAITNVQAAEYKKAELNLQDALRKKPDDVVAKYEAAIKELDCTDGVLFLNDLFGGSPYNAACRLVIINEAYGIVTGVNLPMLIEMCSAQLTDDGSDIQALMERAVEAGKNGTQTFHASQISDDEEDDL